MAVERDKEGRLVIDAVQPESPGAKAGLKKGDIITHVGEQAVKSPEAFREWLQTHGPDESIKLGLLRDGKAVRGYSEADCHQPAFEGQRHAAGGSRLHAG